MKQKKIFKPFERVIYRRSLDKEWECGLFSNEDKIFYYLIGGIIVEKNKATHQILPFADNEHLIGTKDMPEEWVKLEKGELIVGFDYIDSIENFNCVLRKFVRITENTITDGSDFNWNYCIPFSKFNPDDIGETKKHILCVKNGKLVRYKDIT